MTDLDVRAERLLAVGLTAAELLREAGPDAARTALAALEAGELLDVATLLAACVDTRRSRADLLGWWQRRPVLPEHRDDWTEAPRPLVVERSVEPLIRERFRLPERTTTGRSR